jgi:branched-chain amino acid transport system permease protein
VQIVANGLIQGLLIAVLALGFMSVYLPTRVFFIGLAGVYTASPFLVWQIRSSGGPWWIALTAAGATACLLALACELLNHRRLERRGASSGTHLISSLGIFIVIVQVIALIWGNETKTIRTGIDTVYRFAGVTLTRSQALGGAVSLGCLAGYYLWLRFSKLGLQFRALADNPVQLALYGYNTDRLRLLAFAIAGILAAVGGVLTAYDVGFDPHTGLHAVLLAVVAVIVGGRSSFMAPIVGGILVGLLRAQVSWHWSARWQEAATFLVVVLVLFLRPQGLLGQSSRLEARD